MKPLCHQIAEFDTVISFRESLQRDGSFRATLPLTNPRATWPERGDMLAIHIRDSNITLMAFVHHVSPGISDPGEKYARINVTAGFKLRPFGTAMPRLNAPAK